MDTLLTTLRAATQEEWLTFMQLQNERGIPLFHAAAEAAEKKVVPVAQPKKRTVAPKKAPVPVASGADAPEASEYRVAEAEIDHSVCLGRVLKGGEDKRWAPIIFREKQCGGKLVEGSDLCTVCSKRESKYADESKPGPWTGRVTEDPLDWVHMLGTAWAEQKNPKFSASAAAATASASASDSASDSGVSEEMEAVVPVSDKKAAAKAEKAAEKAAEKEAAKAAKAAEKAAEKEAAKAAKEAEKEAAKAAKAAEKATEKATAAPKKATAKATAAPKKAAVAPKKAVVAAAPVDVEFELKMIGDEMYAIKQGNVYEWDADAEKCGDFVGRLTGEEDDPSIDTDAAEVTV